MMKTYVFPTKQDTEAALACDLMARLREKPRTVLGLPTGSTPIGVYASMAAQCKQGGVDLSQVVTFNCDEYLGLEPEHPCSYHYFMQEHLFSHVDIPRGNIHIPDGTASDTDRACLEYEAAIARAGGIDIQLLGIGPNGHICFNEPGTPLESITHVTDLTSETIEANKIFFENDTSRMPRQAITMGITTILNARRVIMIVTGAHKAGIVKRTLTGPIGIDVPGTLLRLHPNAQVYLDAAAAQQL